MSEQKREQKVRFTSMHFMAVADQERRKIAVEEGTAKPMTKLELLRAKVRLAKIDAAEVRNRKWKKAQPKFTDADMMRIGDQIRHTL